MRIGTYIDGRPLTYDEDAQAFYIGETPVTPDMISAYDLAHQLTWADDGMKAWASSMGVTAEARRSAAEALPPPVTSARTGDTMVWLLAGAAALVIVAAVAGVLVLRPMAAKNGPFEGVVTRVTPGATYDDGFQDHGFVDVELKDGTQHKDVAYYMTEHPAEVGDEVTVVREGDGWRVEQISIG